MRTPNEAAIAGVDLVALLLDKNYGPARWYYRVSGSWETELTATEILQKQQASKVRLVAGSLASCNQCFCFWRNFGTWPQKQKKEEKRPSVVVAATYKLLMEKKNGSKISRQIMRKTNLKSPDLDVLFSMSSKHIIARFIISFSTFLSEL